MISGGGVCGTFMYGPVSLKKIRFEENLKEVPRQALNGVIYREDMDLFPILDIRAGMNAVMKHTVSSNQWINAYNDLKHSGGVGLSEGQGRKKK